MRVLFTVASLHPADGGVPESIRAMIQHLARTGIHVEVVTGRAHPDASTLEPTHNRVTTTYATARNRVKRYASFWRTLSERIDATAPDLIHDHGLWLPTNVLSAVEAHRHGIPHLVSPHGMLEPWALQHRELKKTAAWYGYQRAILHRASLLHATAPMEVENLRTQGLSGPIAVIPNGVPLPDRWKHQPSDGSRRQALFLSRIHPKKGLPMFVEAWAQVQPEDWELVIAGPDEDNHRAEVEAKVREHELGDVVTFPGSVRGDDKWALYRNSDLFVLPTHSENFGVVVAEALASGIPALTTTGAPWQILEEKSCGWWTEPSVETIATALRDAVQRSDEERLEMGHRGRALVEERFSWERVAERLSAVYGWVCGESGPPDCVRGPNRRG